MGEIDISGVLKITFISALENYFHSKSKNLCIFKKNV